MKKQILAGLSLIGIFALAACNENAGIPGTSILGSTSDASSSSSDGGSTPSASSSNSSEQFEKVETTVYMVGDSTMCEYPSNTEYYPKYGYGTQMANYFETEYVTIKNLALSGRSSYSFLSEGNYSTLKNNIQEGDYLIIGWGHNDEKYGTDTFRKADYESIDLALADEDSFQYCLYNSYVKLALDKGAFPIIASPIVRLDSNNDYSKNSGHYYTDKSGVFCGDYRKASEDVAKKYNVPFVDLTTLTKNEYQTLTYDVAKKYHRVSKGTDESQGADPSWADIDTTHINIYGANYVAYEFANELKNTSSTLKYYVKENITKPTDSILVKNSDYKWTAYASPDLANYSPSSSFVTTSEGWYGTAFGNMGGNSTSPFTAKESATGVFSVGSNNSGKGKFESGGDGFAFLFKRLEVNRNFKITADITVITAPTTKQGGFGIMLRDDCYINVTEKENVTTNFTAGGYLVNNSQDGGNAIFSRNSGKLSTVSDSAITGLPAKNSVFNVSLEKNGQSTIINVTYNNKTYTTTIMDFEYDSKDSSYMYLGFFANRGIEVKVENVVFTDNGTNTGA